MQIINEITPRRFKFAMFDFDGTISLIRSGWDEIMIEIFLESLAGTETAETESQLRAHAKRTIQRLLGAPSIHLMGALAIGVMERGGPAFSAVVLNDEYLKRMGKFIEERKVRLLKGEASPEQFTIPGALEFLDFLPDDLFPTKCLVSGTAIEYVTEEVALLDIQRHFLGVYAPSGGPDDQVIDRKHFVVQEMTKRGLFAGHEMLAFGDGPTEMRAIKSVNGVGVGIASDETNIGGLDEEKQDLLIQAGADVIIPHFEEWEKLLEILFDENSLDKIKRHRELRIGQ